MMRANMTVQNPDDIEVALTVTMPLKDWARLREELTRTYPAWKLSSAITEMLMRLRSNVCGKDADTFSAVPPTVGEG